MDGHIIDIGFEQKFYKKIQSRYAIRSEITKWFLVKIMSRSFFVIFNKNNLSIKNETGIRYILSRIEILEEI